MSPCIFTTFSKVSGDKMNWGKSALLHKQFSLIILIFPLLAVDCLTLKKNIQHIYLFIVPIVLGNGNGIKIPFYLGLLYMETGYTVVLTGWYWRTLGSAWLTVDSNMPGNRKQWILADEVERDWIILSLIKLRLQNSTQVLKNLSL